MATEFCSTVIGGWTRSTIPKCLQMPDDSKHTCIWYVCCVCAVCVDGTQPLAITLPGLLRFIVSLNVVGFFFLPTFVFSIFDVAFVHEQRQQIALALTSSICRFHFSEAINSLCLCIFCIATVPNSTVTAHSNAHKSKWAHSVIMCDICVCCVCGNRHFVYI